MVGAVDVVAEVRRLKLVTVWSLEVFLLAV